MGKRTKKRRHRAKPGCSGKIRHATLHGAQIAARKLGVADVIPYGPCKHCGGYHIGHSRKDWHRQQRLDQLLTHG